MWEFGSSVPGRVKPMAYILDICCFLAWRLALIGYGKNRLAKCQDNVTGISTHGIRSHECALTQVGTHPDMMLDVVRT